MLSICILISLSFIFMIVAVAVMPWIVIDGGSRQGMTDDYDRCEWVNASSGISSPGLSRPKSRKL